MDFKQARFNMVEQQIRPWDVLDFELLDVLEEIEREYFVTEEQRSYAYADMQLKLPNGNMMLEPKVVARLIQGLALKPEYKVLEIATGSGYATAVMAKLAQHVTTVDLDEQQQQRAKQALEKVGIQNVDYHIGNGLTENDGNHYHAIYIGGGVHKVPQHLLEQLEEGGHLVAVLGDKPVMHALCFTRKGDTFEEKILFDTIIPHLTEHGDVHITDNDDGFIF